MKKTDVGREDLAPLDVSPEELRGVRYRKPRAKAPAKPRRRKASLPHGDGFDRFDKKMERLARSDWTGLDAQARIDAYNDALEKLGWPDDRKKLPFKRGPKWMSVAEARPFLDVLLPVERWNPGFANAFEVRVRRRRPGRSR
jgi:hypothetical protein